jgi:hypothetical protein
MFEADDGYEDDNNSIDEIINEAIYENSIDKAKLILCSDEFSHVSLKEREWSLFLSAHIAVKHSQKGEKVLKYIIFDYKINEDNSINKFINLSDDSSLALKKMFESRKLNENLQFNLELNELPKKSLKV